MLLESVSGQCKELALGGLILVHNRVCVLGWECEQKAISERDRDVHK